MADIKTVCVVCGHVTDGPLSPDGLVSHGLCLACARASMLVDDVRGFGPDARALMAAAYESESAFDDAVFTLAERYGVGAAELLDLLPEYGEPRVAQLGALEHYARA